MWCDVSTPSRCVNYFAEARFLSQASFVAQTGGCNGGARGFFSAALCHHRKPANLHPHDCGASAPPQLRVAQGMVRGPLSFFGFGLTGGVAFAPRSLALSAGTCTSLSLVTTDTCVSNGNTGSGYFMLAFGRNRALAFHSRHPRCHRPAAKHEADFLSAA